MPTFEYQAQHTDGSTVFGVAIGSSLDQVVQNLNDKGLQVLQIGVTTNPNDPLAGMAGGAPTRTVSQPQAVAAPIPPAPAGPETEERSYIATSVIGPMVGQVSIANLLFFFRQLATMLEAGVPIVQSLDTLAGQSRDEKLQGIVREIKGHVEVGRQMSVGMQRYPEVFSTIIVSMVRAGEEGGFLDQALKIVADYLERDLALRTMYRRVTFYPKLELGASIVIILIANYILESIKGPFRLWSPLTEPITWVILTPIIIAYFLFSRIGLANPRVRYNYDAVIANIPYLGKIMRELATARFGRALGALHRGGVPIHRSIQLAADSCGNEWLRAKLAFVPKKLETGVGVSETLSESGAFSPIVMNMVSTGEQTGNLDKMVDKLANYYEDEAETKAMQLFKVLGVVLTLMVAIYIGVIVINFWTGYGQSVAGSV